MILIPQAEDQEANSSRCVKANRTIAWKVQVVVKKMHMRWHRSMSTRVDTSTQTHAGGVQELLIQVDEITSIVYECRAKFMHENETSGPS